MKKKNLKQDVRSILAKHFDPLSAYAPPKKVHESQVKATEELLHVVSQDNSPP